MKIAIATVLLSMSSIAAADLSQDFYNMSASELQAYYNSDSHTQHLYNKSASELQNYYRSEEPALSDCND